MNCSIVCVCKIVCSKTLGKIDLLYIFFANIIAQLSYLLFHNKYIKPPTTNMQIKSNSTTIPWKSHKKILHYMFQEKINKLYQKLYFAFTLLHLALQYYIIFYYFTLHYFIILFFLSIPFQYHLKCNFSNFLVNRQKKIKTFWNHFLCNFNALYYYLYDILLFLFFRVLCNFSTQQQFSCVFLLLVVVIVLLHIFNGCVMSCVHEWDNMKHRSLWERTRQSKTEWMNKIKIIKKTLCLQIAQK